MTARLPRNFASAVVTVALSAWPLSQAGALDAYWQGQFSTQWGHGINGAVSNWYDQPPYNGNAVEVPDGTALFSPAQLLNLSPTVISHQTIGGIIFTAGGDKTFKIFVINSPDNASLTIKGSGVRNLSTKAQEFRVSNGGTLKFKNKAASGSSSGNSIDIYNAAGGRTKFQNRSKASYFTTIVNGDNSRLTFQDKSKCRFCTLINDGKNARISFAGSSESANATLNNLNGKVEFKNTKNRLYLFLDIANSGKIDLGNNRITSKSTVLSPGSSIFFGLPAPLKAANLDADKQLHLDGKAVIFGSSRWKPGDTHKLMKGKPVTGTFDKVKFAGFSKSVKPVLVYQPKSVVVRIEKK